MPHNNALRIGDGGAFEKCQPHYCQYDVSSRLFGQIPKVNIIVF